MTPLTLAVHKGHLETVIELMNLDVDVDAPASNGMAPIHFACKMGHCEILHALVQNCADLDVTDKQNFTPLHWAVIGGHNTIVDYLLQHHDQDMTMINAKDLPDKHTALHIASMKGEEEIVESLLENGATVDSRDGEKMTPLHLAAMNGHLDVVFTLIEGEATINAISESLDTPLSLACTNGHIDVVRLLIRNEADYTMRHKMKSTLLHLGKNSFIQKNELNIVIILYICVKERLHT